MKKTRNKWTTLTAWLMTIFFTQTGFADGLIDNNTQIFWVHNKSHVPVGTIKDPALFESTIIPRKEGDGDDIKLVINIQEFLRIQARRHEDRLARQAEGQSLDKLPVDFTGINIDVKYSNNLAYNINYYNPSVDGKVYCNDYYLYHFQSNGCSIDFSFHEKDELHPHDYFTIDSATGNFYLGFNKKRHSPRWPNTYPWITCHVENQNEVVMEALPLKDEEAWNDVMLPSDFPPVGCEQYGEYTGMNHA